MKVEKSLVSQPIFLVGAERSGTTVLRIMLRHHPQLAWCNEFEYTVDQVSEGGDFPELDHYYNWLETHRIFLATGFVLDRSLSYHQLVNSFLCQKLDFEGKPLVGATVHRHFDRLVQIWSDARFIHLVRDGRDVARSCIGMGWAGNVWTGVSRWIEAEQLWTKFSKAIPAERQIEITYEELIAEPVETLTQLCDFIGVSYDQAMLNYSGKTTYDLPDPSYIGQWKRKLSEREIQLVESRISKMLVERGYEVSGLPTLSITPAMEKRLKLQDWWARAQFRFQRYGPSLFISDYLSRHLRINQWQKSIRLQLNAIDKTYLK
ncbi:MAG: sulfotransferase [Symploca sp. SIO2C1]|nr:sulfotransferase [Symploca sp. SIO2C1]